MTVYACVPDCWLLTLLHVGQRPIHRLASCKEGSGKRRVSKVLLCMTLFVRGPARIHARIPIYEPSV